MERRPEPFSVSTTPQFWDDPHVSGRMLRHYLIPDDGLASRRHDFIDASVDWLVDRLGLASGSRVRDPGCGPGLYAHRLARRGVSVHGVDVSRRSVAHAREGAEVEGLPACFTHGDYLDADLGAGHDAAILIYEDYCVLAPARRVQLVRRVAAALAPGGRLVMDVTAAPGSS